MQIKINKLSLSSNLLIETIHSKHNRIINALYYNCDKLLKRYNENKIYTFDQMDDLNIKIQIILLIKYHYQYKYE